MARAQEAHEWGPIYEFRGTSYRECTDPDCNGHQEWICQLDRWSDAFETLSPGRRAGASPPVATDGPGGGATGQEQP